VSNVDYDHLIVVDTVEHAIAVGRDPKRLNAASVGTAPLKGQFAKLFDASFNEANDPPRSHWVTRIKIVFSRSTNARNV
jgi:hypothetical protein